MKKAKNIVLLIGVIFNSLYILLQLFKFVYDCVTVVPTFSIPIKYFATRDLVPILILLVLIILPVVLLVLNLKNKSGKVLPILSAIVCGLVSALQFFALITPAIPQYLIYSELHIIDTYLGYWFDFMTDGGILYFLGFVLLTVGSMMSLIKSKE